MDIRSDSPDITVAANDGKRRSTIALLYLARGLRGFGDGFAMIILPAYMTALGYDAASVGIVATASLLGTALLTLMVGWIAPRHDLELDFAGFAVAGFDGVDYAGADFGGDGEAVDEDEDGFGEVEFEERFGGGEFYDFVFAGFRGLVEAVVATAAEFG